LLRPKTKYQSHSCNVIVNVDVDVDVDVDVVRGSRIMDVALPISKQLRCACISQHEWRILADGVWQIALHSLAAV